MNNVALEYPWVTYTVLTSSSTNLTKHYSLFFGDLRKNPPGLVFDGVAEQITTTLDKLSGAFEKFSPHQALCHGVADQSPVKITTKGNESADCYSRSKEYFKYPSGQSSLILADYDYDEHGTLVHAPEELLAIISSFMPEISSAAYISKPSASSGIRYSATDKVVTNDYGFHLYWVAVDGADIPRFIDVLFQRLILAGHGHVKVSRSGSLLVRTVVDGAIKSPERVDFVAPASIGEGLYRKELPTSMQPGAMLDTRKLQDLSDAELRDYDAILDQLKGALHEEARKVRQDYAINRAAKTGIPLDETIKTLERADAGVLDHTFSLTLNDGSTVAVEEVFLDPRKWNHHSLRDPLDPEDGSDKAKIFCNKDGSIMINSFAHGGAQYVLHDKPVKLYEDVLSSSLEETQEVLDQFGESVMADLDKTDTVSIK